MEIAIALLMIIIIVIFSLLTSFVTFTDSGVLEDKTFMRIIMITVTVCSIIAMFLMFAHLSKPKPIDVYRGNTTLEITYKDNVPIDSVVIWKGK